MTKHTGSAGAGHQCNANMSLEPACLCRVILQKADHQCPGPHAPCACSRLLGHDLHKQTCRHCSRSRMAQPGEVISMSADSETVGGLDTPPLVSGQEQGCHLVHHVAWQLPVLNLQATQEQNDTSPTVPRACPVASRRSSNCSGSEVLPSRATVASSASSTSCGGLPVPG